MKTYYLIPLYFLSLLLIGLGYLSILPPFEGFDETAHYSSIRQIADTDSLPVFGFSYLDKFISEYKGPLPYSSGQPPFDKDLVYTKFFANSNLVLSYLNNYRFNILRLPYQKGISLNWEAQHPPLYYLLLAKLIKHIKNISFLSQFFILRFFSYLLSLSGIALASLAILRKKEILLGFILYPIILPMFFQEFARLGNDSLCLFLMGLLVWLTALWEKKNYFPIYYSFFIGITIGIGLLAKALFIPVLAGFGIFLLINY